jgi:hypothetical protein
MPDIRWWHRHIYGLARACVTKGRLVVSRQALLGGSLLCRWMHAPHHAHVTHTQPQQDASQQENQHCYMSAQTSTALLVPQSAIDGVKSLRLCAQRALPAVLAITSCNTSHAAWQSICMVAAYDV